MLDKFNALCDSYELEIYTLNEAINRVRNVHFPIPAKFGNISLCGYCITIYPCLTIRELDKE
jgi:hypothetical protein